MLKQVYFIGTGALEAMFTLNVQRMSDDPSLNQYFPISYICNLASVDHPELAIEKAKTYVEAMKERIGSEDLEVIFSGIWDEPINYRRGKLSVRDTQSLDLIESGFFPFGKHSGARIDETPESYVLYWSDQYESATNLVSASLAAACRGVALEKGYIAKRDTERAERHEQDMKSNFIGDIGDRMVFEGEVIFSFYKNNDYYSDGYWINKVRCGDDIVSYIGGKSLGEKGETVKFKATVKDHTIYNEVKETKVNRPMKV